ncbi:MAG: DAK2 domain-containing protein [Oscillospiraceae bacterium]|nr:DAK2 domain-containing protein [Oscillospiraceae bacterium]
MKHIDGAAFCRMVVSGAAAIGNAAQEINELNVFPVPDGDTGINMSMTMNDGVKELDASDKHAGKQAHAFSQGLLRGARGNSGVILSLLFRGFAKYIKTHETISGAAFAAAMAEGVQTAYGAVMKPAEGTILTVCRVSSQRGIEYAAGGTGIDSVIDEMVKCANVALAETVKQNPVLQKAGVVDAGAKGYCYILEGMLAALRGSPVLTANGNSGAVRDSARFSDFSSEEILFGYCTELLIIRPKNDRSDPARLRAFLETCGDSLVFVEDEDIIKIHVHTDNPGRVLAQALAHGELTKIKIENMREQHTEMISVQSAAAAAPKEVMPQAQAAKDYGFVAVCAGEGIETIFHDLGTDSIVQGGQTMNPSTQEILDSIKHINAETVFVLPNNKNIIMAAEQCIPLAEKNVIVIPSRNIPQGVTAMLNFDGSASVEENRAAMTESLDAVTSVMVTAAARDSQFDGNEIAEGDHMALLNGALHFNSPSRGAVLRAVADALAEKEPSYITLYYGDDVGSGELEDTEDMLKTRMPMTSIQSVCGGQPVYSYIISAE